MKQLHELIESHEDWLMEQVLHYAQEHGYTQFTSVHEKAWRKSIAGLSRPLLRFLQQNRKLTCLGPEEDYTRDLVSHFGIEEAKRHRTRGVSLPRFLSLLKYYRRSYIDLIRGAEFDRSYEEKCLDFIDGYFNRLELGFCAEWAEITPDSHLEELEMANRGLIYERNMYLSVFEEDPNPIILLDATQRIENFNRAASRILFANGAPEAMEGLITRIPPWLVARPKSFAESQEREIRFELELAVGVELRRFEAKLTRRFSVTGKLEGIIVLLRELPPPSEEALRATGT